MSLATVALDCRTVFYDLDAFSSSKQAGRRSGRHQVAGRARSRSFTSPISVGRDHTDSTFARPFPVKTRMSLRESLGVLTVEKHELSKFEFEIIEKALKTLLQSNLDPVDGRQSHRFA